MRNRFEKDIQTLHNELIEMGAMIEASIDKAVSALITRDDSLATQVIALDNDIDNKERSIERHCLKLLLQQQPVANDLRLISTAIKMIADMERIGDQASDISEITLYIIKNNFTFSTNEFEGMANATIKMVRESIDAFVNSDLELAQSVISYDDVVDDYFNKIKALLISSVKSNASLSEEITDFLMIAKYFERIGDHAVNIAEWVIFSLTGQHKNERIL